MNEAMGIVAADVERYLIVREPERDALLRRLEHEAEARDIPIIGPYAGRVLQMLAKVSGAQRLLEIGTAIGYSTIWLARAVDRSRGAVTTIEQDPSRAEEASRNVAEAGLSHFVQIERGEATEVIPRLDGSFDFVFLDAEKHQYRQLVELLLPALQPGGLIVTDNVLWGGRVARARGKPDPTTRAVREFNEFLRHNPELETVILPVRDGLAVSRKLRP